jgi:hypothetical protein
MVCVCAMRARSARSKIAGAGLGGAERPWVDFQEDTHPVGHVIGERVRSVPDRVDARDLEWHEGSHLVGHPGHHQIGDQIHRPEWPQRCDVVPRREPSFGSRVPIRRRPGRNLVPTMYTAGRRWDQLVGLVILVVVFGAIALLIAGYGVAVGLGALAGLVLGFAAGTLGSLWLWRGSGRSVTVGGMAWSSDRPMAELMADGLMAEMRDLGEISGVDLGTIRSVMPVLATTEASGLSVQLVTIEQHEAGLALTFEVHAQPGTLPPASMARVAMADDIGTVYRASAQGQGGSPGQMRYQVTAIPAVPSAATRLDVRIERFLDPFPGGTTPPSGRGASRCPSLRPNPPLRPEGSRQPVGGRGSVPKRTLATRHRPTRRLDFGLPDLPERHERPAAVLEHRSATGPRTICSSDPAQGQRGRQYSYGASRATTCQPRCGTIADAGSRRGEPGTSRTSARRQRRLPRTPDPGRTPCRALAAP